MKFWSLKTIVGLGFVGLLVNTGYIAAFASPTIFYMGNVLLHLALGVVLAFAFAALLARDADVRKWTLGPALFFVAALATGVYLAVYGNIHDHAMVLKAHIWVGAIGTAALLPYAIRQARQGARGFGWSMQAAAVFALAFPLLVGAYNKAYPAASDRIVNPTTAPLDMTEEGGGPKSPFFPSSAKTNVGGIIPSNFFMDSEKCGECHKEVYEQWKSSVHHFASFNNQYYRKSIEYMQSVVGTQPSKWCAGCHDHAVFFNGRFDKPIKDQIDTPEARAGLACTSCHAITHVDSSMGNADFTIDYPPLHELMTSKNKYIRAIDSFMLYLNPEPHRRSFMKPFMKQDQSEFCAACHKNHLDVPVNGYRWFRGFDDYDNWQASGVSGQGARSFYYPDKTATCVDCHMAPIKSNEAGHLADGTIHSHRFATANTAVPFANHDDVQLKTTEDFLKAGFISVDIFAVSPEDPKSERTPMVRRAAGDSAPRLATQNAVGEESDQAGPVVIRDVGQVAAPIDKAQPRLAPGSTARVDVVVRTRKIGHFFPGGTIDALDIWLELQARDSTGRVVFWSGQVQDDGHVEPGAHFYRSLVLDAAGNPIDKRNAWQARTVMYVRAIPPGAADSAHFRVKIPADAQGPITFTAKLNYRKFGIYGDFAYAGQPKPGQNPNLITKESNSAEYSYAKENIPANVSGEIKGEIPKLPITVLATATATIPLGDGKTPTEWKSLADKGDRERWNDWGIGLLLQGDLKGAEYAFKKVTEAEPGYADGWINVARALLQEGENDAAKPYIERGMKEEPKLDRLYYYKALTQKTDGDYDGALKSLRIVTASYPRDRVVQNQVGRLLFLQRKYAEALKALEAVAAIDPEDVQMHYTAMLCYRGLGKDVEAAREEKLFLRFKAEESSQSITGAVRQVKPEWNNERQQIHEHESVELGPAAVARPKGVVATRTLAPAASHDVASLGTTAANQGNGKTE
jgi:tetratricopeptide (TPR) repeat protein